ncbi:MAG: pilus assembly protein [Anaerolineae bacterium]|nr:pilus assembly protein [Anaerolineae bacterium]
MNRRKREQGQSLLETAIVLLLLVMLLYGVVEVGFGLRNYLLVSNANREAARFAARGRFNNEQIADRLVSSGGVERAGSQDVPFLRTEEITPATASRNTGIIITTIVMDDEGNFDYDEDVTRYAEGVFSCGSCAGVPPAYMVDADLGLRILPPAEYANYSLVDLADIWANHSDVTDQINDERENDYDLPRLDNQIIVVETFFIHRPWGRGLLPDPWVMYVKTEMRVATGRSGGD